MIWVEIKNMDAQTFRDRLRQLIDDNRATCLWWCRKDWYPHGALDTAIVLRRLQRGAGVEVFKAATALIVELEKDPTLAPPDDS